MVLFTNIEWARWSMLSAILIPACLASVLVMAEPQEPQPLSSDISVELGQWTDLSAPELLAQAKALATSNPSVSAQLANQSLDKAQLANDLMLVAQSHEYLASLARRANNTEQAKYHLTQGFETYKQLQDKANQILISVSYANVLMAEKNFAKAAQVIDELMPFTLQHGDPSLTGLVLYSGGKNLYKQKRYALAITEFSEAAEQLTASDDMTQTLLANCYHEIAQSYKHLKDVPNSIVNYQKSFDIHMTRNDQASSAKALKNIAMAENRQQNYVSALDHALHSLEILQGLDSTSADYAELALLTGIIYRHIGYYDTALKYIQQANAIYQRDKDIPHLAEVANQSGLVYVQLKQQDVASSFFQRTIGLASKQVKPSTKAAAYRELGYIAFRDGDFEHAKELLMKADTIYRTMNNNSRTARVNMLLGKTHHAMGQDQVAIEYLNQALALAKSSGSVALQAESLNNLGRIEMQSDLTAAISTLKRGLAVALEYDLKKIKLFSYQWLKLAYKALGNNQQALSYAEQEIAISKEIHHEREQAELMRAKAKIDSYKMEMDLDALREKVKLDSLSLTQKNNEIEIARQASRISELELNKKQYTNMLLAVLLAGGLIVSWYIYRGFIATREQNRRLDYLAARDPLTGCFNRRILFERLNSDFDSETRPACYSVILADIDFFKSINDIHGHSVGDAVLRGVAAILQANIRKSDTLARFGGEEFCVLLPSASAECALAIAEKMREQIASKEVENIAVTTSFGVATLVDDSQAACELVDRADIALYKSKEQGRDRVTLWQK